MEKEVVVVTGSSGRIGERLVQRLAEAGKYQPIGLDFAGKTSRFPEFEYIFVDLSSDDSVRCAFDRIRKVYGNKIASIVHLAAFYSFEGKHLKLYDKITVQGTRRLLDEAKKMNVEQFLFTSTMLVHDPTKRGQVITEDSPIEGKWHYPASKVKTERLIHEQHGDVPTVILRIAGCYDDRCNCVPLSQHMSRIFEKQLASFVFPGNSNNGVCYTHFDDLIDMMMLFIEKRKELPKESIYLCAEEDSVSYRDLQTRFAQLIWNKKWPMIWIPKIVAKLGSWVQNHTPFMHKPFIKPWMVDLADDNYEVSMEKAKQNLQWEPKRSLRQTLPAMVEDMKKDPVAWYKRHGIPLPHKLK